MRALTFKQEAERQARYLHVRHAFHTCHATLLEALVEARHLLFVRRMTTAAFRDCDAA